MYMQIRNIDLSMYYDCIVEIILMQFLFFYILRENIVFVV